MIQHISSKTGCKKRSGSWFSHWGWRGWYNLIWITTGIDRWEAVMALDVEMMGASDRLTYSTALGIIPICGELL